MKTQVNYKADAKKIREFFAFPVYNPDDFTAKSLAWRLFRSKSKDRIALCQKIIDRERQKRFEKLNDNEKTNFIFIKKVKENLTQFSELLPDSGYSMGEIATCKSANFTGCCSRTSEYAKSCTWKAKHGTITATIPVKYAVKGQNLGGLITIVGGKVRGEIHKCSFLEITQIKKYCEDTEVIEKKGYGFFYIDEYDNKIFYHAPTYADAVQTLKKRKISEKNYKKNQKIREKNFKIFQAAEKKDMKALKIAIGPQKLKKMYNFADSQKAGNCEAGTLNFFRLCGYDRNESATGEDIIFRAFKYAPKLLDYMCKIFLF